MKNFLIKLLFKLLGEQEMRLHNVSYLFGASTYNHESRKKRWEKALMRLWRDKDILDYLYYQSEADKEKIFQGKVDVNLSRGARIRTLFLVYSAHMAHQKLMKTQRSTATDKAEAEQELKKVSSVYKELVSIK